MLPAAAAHMAVWSTFLAEAPRLRPEDGHRVQGMAGEIPREARGRERFAAFPNGRFDAAAEIFACYRIPSLGITRRAKKDARGMFLRDSRVAERLSLLEMQLLHQILRRFPARQLLVRPNAMDQADEELVMPGRVRDSKVGLSAAGGFLKQKPEIANYISLELVRGRSMVPAYKPFIVPGASAAPWDVPPKEHLAASARWRTRA